MTWFTISEDSSKCLKCSTIIFTVSFQLLLHSFVYLGVIASLLDWPCAEGK